ncbi:pilus assembly protein PilM [Fluviispira sanaruensis]|uniref:General secretion pathway protein GspL n=1 Tax=Fluviispira sanaruensis TaxID=2493639 RepID=A0A4P2VKK6_FLUSA|nr:pilus assembly protein PilM [Fluviispira sanaruensis]BBH52220.1 general secretion pathway protein GspL [Fluviispira sanaruensis]
MQKILGLDIGSYSIKAVIIWNDYKNYIVHQFFEQLVEIKEGLDERTAQSQAIAELLAKNKPVYDVMYAALDSRFASIRRVDFDNIKKRDIPSFLENELESSSPFAIEDSILDYQLIDYTKSHSSLLAVLCKKESIRDLIENFEREHLRTKVVDVDNLTYLNMISFLQVQYDPISQDKNQSETYKEEEFLNSKNSCSLIINIGHSKTTLTYLNNKKILFTRIINMAGLYFTEVIKKEFNLKYEEADALKCYVSSIDSSTIEENSKSKIVSLILANAVSELAGEISRTIQTFQEKNKEKIRCIYLTGGSSVIKGISHQYEEYLKIPVREIILKKENFSYNTDSTNLGSFVSVEPSLNNISQSLAIAMRGLPINGAISKINLRKGEFAQISNYDKLIKQIVLYSSAALVVIFCLLLSYFIRSITYGNQISNLKTQFRKDVISMFSGEPYPLRLISSRKDWNFDKYGSEALLLLNQSLKNKKRLVDTLAETEPPFVLKILNQISEAVPKPLYFEVTQFKINDSAVYIEAETSSSANVKKIIELVSALKIFEQVTKNKEESKIGSANKLIHFSFTAIFKNDEA